MIIDLKKPTLATVTPIPLKNDRPQYSLKKIEEIRNHLIDDVGFALLENPFNDALIVRYIIGFCSYMKWDLHHADSLYESIYPYARNNPVFTEKVNEELAYRLAGAYLHLHAGIVLPIKGSKVYNAWLGVEVTSAQLSRKQFNRQLMMVKFNVTAGHVAGYTYSQEFPVSLLSKVFKESLKFSKFISLVPEDIFGMHFMAYLALNEKGEHQFTKIVTNTQQLESNKALRIARGQDCLFDLNYSCVECPVGADRCDRATHLITYDLLTCKNTNAPEHQHYVDAERHDGYCMQCAKVQAAGNLYKQRATKV